MSTDITTQDSFDSITDALRTELSEIIAGIDTTGFNPWQLQYLDHMNERLAKNHPITYLQARKVLQIKQGATSA